MVEKINIPIEPFDGFPAVIPGHNTMQCKTWVPKMKVTLGNYTFVDIFYVFDVSYTNVVFIFQWMYDIWYHMVNYQIPKMKFQDSKGVLRVVRGQHTYPNQVVTCNIMRYILRHGGMELDAEFHITSPKPNINFFEHPKEIEKLLQHYEKVFRGLPHGRPPDRGVEHNIVLEECTSPIKIPPYIHPNKFGDGTHYTKL